MAKKAREAKARAKPQVKAAKAPAGAVLGKTPREYYEAIKLPLAVLVVWSVIGFLAALAVPPLVFITALVSLILALATGLYVGWTMVKRERGGLPQALVAGAALGVIANAVGRALDVILSLMQAGALGAGVAVVAAIIGIVAGGIIEAALAAIGALAAKYV
ncbi:MAG: hypothetical protein QXH27_02385 [Candidatus Micrarchaeia archaeon]